MPYTPSGARLAPPPRPSSALVGATVLRSTFTRHPVTGAQLRLFLLHHPKAKRLPYSVSSRWQTFRSFSDVFAAIRWFEEQALAWA